MNDLRKAAQAALDYIRGTATGTSTLSIARINGIVDRLEAALAAPNEQPVIDAAIIYLDAIEGTQEASDALEVLNEATDPFRQELPGGE